jgi:hypothetical protein
MAVSPLAQSPSTSLVVEGFWKDGSIWSKALQSGWWYLWGLSIPFKVTVQDAFTDGDDLRGQVDSEVDHPSNFHDHLARGMQCGAPQALSEASYCADPSLNGYHTG